MSSQVSRREFIRKTTATASAVTLVSVGASRTYAANEKVQIGWIGVGRRATQLMTEVLAHVPAARTAAVCDLIPAKIEAAQKLAERDKPNGYTDFGEMIDKEKLDGIIVATEPNAHAPVVVPVLQAGIHCFAEKPMDVTVEAVDAITKAARASKAIYQIGTQRRYNPGYLSSMEVLHSGRIGKVTIVQGAWHWPWKGGLAPVARDGGFLIEQASHHTDVAAWALRDQAPVSCVSMGMNQLGKSPNVFRETHSATAWKFPKGQIFTYTHMCRLSPHFTEEQLTVMAEWGGIEFPQAKLLRTGTKEHPEGPVEQLGEASGTDWGKGTKEELIDFVKNVRTGGRRRPNANVETGRIATLMVIMGRMAMANPATNAYEPRVIHWKDLGTTTDPS